MEWRWSSTGRRNWGRKSVAVKRSTLLGLLQDIIRIDCAAGWTSLQVYFKAIRISLT